MTKAKTIRKKSNRKKHEFAYTVSLAIGADTYVSASDDLTAAILGLKPSKINARPYFTLEHDGKKATLSRPIARCKRIIAHPLTAALMGKTLVMLLK